MSALALWLWLSAWPPLDLTTTVSSPSEADGLRLDAVLQGSQILAQLTNTGTAPLEVLLGYRCGGPRPFIAVVDGVVRSFQRVLACRDETPLTVRLLPGATQRVPVGPTIRDGRAHQLVVRYQQLQEPKLWKGLLTSAPLAVAAGTFEIALRANPKPGGAVDLEFSHRWHGPTTVRFLARLLGACPRPYDRLSIDGADYGLVAETACAGPGGNPRELLAPGETFTTHATIRLAPGRHHLRAQYSVPANEIIVGGIEDWHGEVETQELEVRVP